MRYVALGDSHTIGTSVREAERWPNQLVERLTAERLQLVANLGINGYTSADLIADELPRLDELRPDFVTVLIGVNDVVQRVPQPEYAENVAMILNNLLARLPTERIVAVATPDYTATPQGASYGEPRAQREAIERANDLLREACAERGVHFVSQILAISQEAAHDRSLVADDGLHPSGKQYARWVDAVAPVVEKLLRG
jgi:acyl-CoA thioesterase-1